MKKFFISINLLLFAAFAFAQWTWQNPLPQGHDLFSSYFTNPNTGYSVGYYGTIIKTTDGGLNWTILASGTTKPFYSVFFASNEIGFAVGGDFDGSGIILKTTDAGETWINVLEDSLYKTFYSVFFTDINTGYVGGGDGILKTTDGGLTWIDITDFNTKSMYFTDENTGYAGGDNNFMKTTDAGNSWTAIFPTIYQTLINIIFPSQDTGYALGISDSWSGNAILHKTTDGGISWNYSIIEHTYGGRIFFTDNSTGYINYDHYIYKTSDGGENWVSIPAGTNKSLRNLFFPELNTGYAVGEAGTIVKTTDAGLSWHESPNQITSNLNSVYFINGTKGFAVGGGNNLNNDDCMLMTTDAGQTWNAVIQFPSVNYNHLFSVHFPNESTGFAAGVATIIKTTDGGATWYIVYYNSEKTINSITFPNDSFGFAVGNEGTILKTTNSGANWIPLNISTSYDFTSVFFLNPQTGFISSSNGKILKTIDSGNNWTVFESSEHITSLFFTDNNNGYASTYSGNILITKDAGTSWNSVYSGFDKYLSSIYFPDGYVGYAVGAVGTILKTENAGVTWKLIPSVTFKYLTSVFFTDINTGYVVGSEGTILKTTNGGGLFTPENHLSQTAFNIYPNPAKSTLNITSNSIESKPWTVSLFHINGQIVHHQSFENQQKIEIDLSTLPKGIYLLKIQTSDKTEFKKLIKQ